MRVGTTRGGVGSATQPDDDAGRNDPRRRGREPPGGGWEQQTRPEEVGGGTAPRRSGIRDPDLSDHSDMIEPMFEQRGPTRSSPEVIARFDELFERRYPSRTTESSALLDRIGASWRAQNRAAASTLVAIGELFAYRLTRCSDTEEWAVDTEGAGSAEGG